MPRRLPGSHRGLAAVAAHTHGPRLEPEPRDPPILLNALDRWLVDLERLLHAKRREIASLHQPEVLLGAEPAHVAADEPLGIDVGVLGDVWRAGVDAVGVRARGASVGQAVVAA